MTDTDSILKTINGFAPLLAKKLLEIQSDPKVRSKGDGTISDIVTHGDTYSEEVIIAHLRDAFPDIPFLAEESGGERRTEGPLWIIDPVDGTGNYARSLPEWAVSIALAMDGKTQFGYVMLPAQQKRCWTAISWPVRRTVSNVDTVKQAHVWIDYLGNNPRVDEVHHKLLTQSFRPQSRMSCVASMIALVEGKVDGYLFPKPLPYDIAAAALIVEKAGGKVTEWDGSPWNVFSKSIVASNGLIHDQLLELVNS